MAVMEFSRTNITSEQIDEWLRAYVTKQDADEIDYVSTDWQFFDNLLGDMREDSLMPADVLAWWVAEHDGGVGGAIITYDDAPGAGWPTPDAEHVVRRRYASTFQDFRSLIPDRDAVGFDLARSFVRHVLDVREDLIKASL